jgi:hypothetical protein
VFYVLRYVECFVRTGRGGGRREKVNFCFYLKSCNTVGRNENDVKILIRNDAEERRWCADKINVDIVRIK